MHLMQVQENNEGPFLIITHMKTFFPNSTYSLADSWKITWYKVYHCRANNPSKYLKKNTKTTSR